MLKKINRQELREVIEEALWEVLREQTGDQTVLQTSAQEIVGKFPTLRQTLINLLTLEYEYFVKDVQWVAPKPTTFRILLKNDQGFHLKWTGRTFEAQITGKRFYLSKIDEFQQALDRLNDLLKYGPITTGQDEEFEEGDREDFGGGGGGGGDFPGAEGGGEFPEGEPPAEGGEEEAGAPEGEESTLPDSDEVEFEEPGESPDEEF